MSAIPSPPQTGTSITRPPGSSAVTAIGVAPAETFNVDTLNLTTGETVTGSLTLSDAASKIVPGATSLALRNNADSANNVLVSNAGLVTIRAGLVITASGETITAGDLTFGGTSQKIVAPTTSLLVRDHGDANTNITVLDSGATTIRGAVTPTGGVAAAGGFSATPCGQIHTGGAPARASTDGSELTPTTTTVYTVEIFVPCNMTLTGVRHFNGSDVTGNVTVGLYTSAGVAIAGALSAATAGSGTDAYQSIPFATPYAAVGPAKYLIGFQYSSATARPNCHLIGTGFGIAQASATIGVTAISPLPTAFVATTQPIAGLY